ncbi:hypothetical protein AOL_s00215g657 [Orbilia oligospora ATCC 24927]|uniref:C2H2-type domain-containing protein n=2 Tax=Orbilia oligospora TaxID=2813651 RepID=G1XUJ9_ARTOA|nr:hypothetical protein AOL_s00215g657 [Orbilia oligospora ATCC 24927]EGX43201.1 hypothetical protein AOL_s00215g657 [Orbilia oligospora ATCC 24927]KAF3273198.1 hypothetical protein TWF970_009359 [Orbilia oligospora]
MRTPTPTLEHFLGLDKEEPIVWSNPNEFQDYNIFPDPELQDGFGSPAGIEPQGLELTQLHSPPHQSRSKRRKSRKSLDPTYICPTTNCGQGFSDRKSLGKHRNQAHEEKEYKCICGHGYTRQDGLKGHHLLCEKHKQSLSLKGSTGIVKRMNSKHISGDRLGQIGASTMVPNHRSSRHSSRSSANGSTVVTPPITVDYRLRKRARDQQAGEDNWRAKCHKAEREKEENDRTWMEKYHELQIQHANEKAAWMNARHELEEKLARAEGTD